MSTQTLSAAEVLAHPLREDAQIVLATEPVTADEARDHALMPWMAQAWADDFGGPGLAEALDLLAAAVVTPFWEDVL